MRILVAGGAGYVGSTSVEGFLAAGHQVVVYDDLSTGHGASVIKPARLVRGSVQDRTRLENLLRDSVGPRVQVKAAGRFRNLADVRSAATAGAGLISAELTPELASAARDLFAESSEPEAERPAVQHESQRPRAVASRAS